MASVYFDPAVGGDGSTVTDDSNPATGLANGGHRSRFISALVQIVAVAANVVTKAAQAAASAATATSKAGEATTAASDAIAAYDAFDDRYLGAKAGDPTLDNDGNALITGAMYWRTTAPVGLKVYTGSSWAAAALSSVAASGISVTPTGTLAATDVQSALAELDGDISASLRATVSIISGNTAATAQTTYICSAALTLTLPASPTQGDWVEVRNATGAATGIVIARNGKNIESLAEDMNIDMISAFRLVWTGNATIGWAIA